MYKINDMKNKYKKLSETLHLAALSCLMLLLSASGNAQTVKKTIANGSWTNPAIWSPAGVPVATSPFDTVVIQHQVTYTTKLDARAVSTKAFKIKTGASLAGTSINDTLVLGVTNNLLNYGTIAASGLLAIGDINISTTNYGEINTGRFAQSDLFNNEPWASITSKNLITSSNFINKANSIILVNDTLITSDNMTNNGDISTGNWINAGTITGTNGQFCVGGMFLNESDISGTLDICDATPGTFYDINVGTISSSVTYCAVGPCATNVAINDITDPAHLIVYPNPSTGIFTLSAAINSYITVSTITGKQILSQQISTINPSIDLTNQPNGVYFLQFTSEKGSFSKKIILSN